MASPTQSLKLAPFFFFFFFFIITSLVFFAVPFHALNIGIHANGDISLSKECSRICESKFCAVPPFLRYGKYCGLLYSGCPGEQPCDRLDACCMKHDQCVQVKGSYLSQQCNQEFINCVDRFKKSGSPTFNGNTCKVDEVVHVIKDVINAAIIAGKIFGKP
ncbi:phospholipase A2-alpha-like [Olea europaea var. sylvestris]|uniref:phospholipase A2-alpha-like n=1 Tax=Olea europaea var. sylvestris TaxID=158386 RepID=UPI000C1D8047|nr:phospholipase A2-alpha-like [Olea europaea var. sylvestris]